MRSKAGLIYRTEPTTKKVYKQKKNLKSKKTDGYTNKQTRENATHIAVIPVLPELLAT